MMKLFAKITLGIFWSVTTLLSQNTLTPDQAIKNTIENNFGIQVAGKNIEVATNNASKVALGYNPTVNANAGTTLNLGGSKQNFSSGMENTVSNSLSYGGNASVTGQYTLYDKSRDLSLEQLNEILNLTNVQLRQTVELNIVQLMARYYDVARLTSTLNVLEETIEVSNRRLERVQFLYEYGQGTGLDILNAEVDVQRDSINYINSAQLLANAKRDLNVTMGLDLDRQFDIDTSVTYDRLDLNVLQNNLQENNVELILLDKNVDVNTLDLSIIDAGKKPILSASGAYTFSLQKNPTTAFITSSNSRGLNLGLNLNWNLYDGGLRKQRKQNVELNLQTLQLQREQLLLELSRDLNNAWENYRTALFILNSEAQNLSTSRLNFERTEEQFNLGQSSSLEFRQAQLNLLNATTNYTNAKYDAKAIEVILHQLAGSLLK